MQVFNALKMTCTGIFTSEALPIGYFIAQFNNSRAFIKMLHHVFGMKQVLFFQFLTFYDKVHWAGFLCLCLSMLLLLIKCYKLAQPAHVYSITVGIANLWRRRKDNNFLGLEPWPAFWWCSAAMVPLTIESSMTTSVSTRPHGTVSNIIHVFAPFRCGWVFGDESAHLYCLWW